MHLWYAQTTKAAKTKVVAKPAAKPKEKASLTGKATANPPRAAKAAAKAPETKKKKKTILVDSSDEEDAHKE